MKFTEHQTALFPPKTKSWLFEKLSIPADDKRRVIRLVKDSKIDRELKQRMDAEHEANRILVREV